MRTLLSYFFLITLFFPSVVETIHAIDGSHHTHDDESTYFHHEIPGCDLALYFSIDLDDNSNDYYLAQNFNSFSKEYNSISQNLISNCSFRYIQYRGPPIS